ncbi:MAG: TIGR02996 domain-containing protein, partial [Gemmataceae bacterium]|nr:TIGR02996 domain-containing protein [Gemmataceae bacterium]
KFWNIDVKTRSFTVTYGKCGGNTQSNKKTFTSALAAEAEAKKAVAAKLKAGYFETTFRPATPDEQAFEDTLRANPHDFAAWCAYADWLAERGDPRGEFMQTQLALEDESRPKKERNALKKKEAELLVTYENEWLGPLAEFGVKGGMFDYTFTRGWLNRVTFGNLAVNQARALSRTTSARLLRELVVTDVAYEHPLGRKSPYIHSHYALGPDVPKGTDYRAALHPLAKCPHLGGLRLFQFGDGDTALSGHTNASFDDYSTMNTDTDGAFALSLVKQMPNLEELYLFAPEADAAELFALPAPKLKVLLLHHARAYPLGTLAANPSLTNLAALLCHPGSIEPDADGAHIGLAELRAVCRSKHLVNLTNLRLRQTDFGDEGAKEIVASGILKRFKVLDLQGGSITDAGAKVLADAPELKALEFLNLRSNALTKAGKDLLKATKVKVDLAEQYNLELFDGQGLPGYLYDGDYE